MFMVCSVLFGEPMEDCVDFGADSALSLSWSLMRCSKQHYGVPIGAMTLS